MLRSHRYTWESVCSSLADRPCLHPVTPQAIAPAVLPRPRAPPPVPSSSLPSSSRPDLLLRLLETDIKHTTSDLSQVIRFLCDNAFLVGVEGRVGELEDEERRGVKELGQQEDVSGEGEGGMEGVQSGLPVTA